MPPKTKKKVVAAKVKSRPVVAQPESDNAENKQPAGPTSQEVRKFLELAQQRFKLSAEAESDWRKEGLEDLKFSTGDQWPQELKSRREKSGKPCLTFNKVRQTVKQVTNNQRQQRPSPQVNPAGSGATQEVAEVYQGILRHIDVLSDAEVARDIAFEMACRCGKGIYRDITEYVDDDGDSSDQEIVTLAVPNPFTWYGDPTCVKPDRSDRKWGFFIEDIEHDEYKARYPDSALASMTDMGSVGDSSPDWANSKTVRIAEYFYVEFTRVKGKARETLKRNVKWAKINAIEILEGNTEKTAGKDWPGKYIPVYEVLGDDLIVDGKRFICGMVRDAKDPARAYNYHVSAATETVMLAPKAPFVGWKGQFSDPKWETANTESWAYLEVEPVNIDGLPAPSLPQRNVFEPPIESLVKLLQIADNDGKATTGIYDASLGKAGPEQSGRAILERKQQGDLATLDLTDNLARIIRFEGRVKLDLIPKIYDAPRVQRIINPDQTVKHVGVYNSQTQDLDDPENAEEFANVDEIYDLGVGRYDVTISVGPSYQTKRQEAAAGMLELIKTVPIVQQAAPDLVIQNLDIPGADVIAKRIKKTLPPALQDEGNGSPEQQLQQAQAQLAQVSQQHDQLAQALAQANEIIKSKQTESAARIVIAKLQSATQIAVAEINTKAQKDNVRAQIEADELGQIHDAAHEIGMQADQQAHVADQAQQSQDFQADQANQNRAAAAQQAAESAQNGAQNQ